MSDVLDRIARLRRAAASYRLGPDSQNGHHWSSRAAWSERMLAELLRRGNRAWRSNGGPPQTPAPPVNGSAAGPAASVWTPPGMVEGPGGVVEAPGGVVEAPGGVVEAPGAPAVEVDEPAPLLPPAEPFSEPDPAPPAVEGEPGFIERGRMRRRARYLRRLREVQLRDIGGFALELHRFGRARPDLVRAKLVSAAQTDQELRTLERALGEQHRLRELREAGIGGACANCGAVHGSTDRFCASCGRTLVERSR